MSGRRVFALLYVCSGAAGLVYEIVWTRVLTLELGHTTAAVGTVLAAFMGGLAAGAAIGGRYAPGLDPTRALRAYAVLEGVIALSALALPLALRALEPLLAAAYADEPTWTFAWVRVASSFLLVTVPAMAMGATFPLAVRWFAGGTSGAARDVAHLYALNTLGAAAGALAAGFLLIPALGLRTTTFAGVALNAVAGAGAWLVSNGRAGTAPAPATPRKTPRPRTAARQRQAVDRPAPRLLTGLVLGLAGFVTLVYEVAFTRALALAIGPTSYAFAAMLTAFIAGLAIGAGVAPRLARADRRVPLAMGLLLFAGVAVGAWASWFVGTGLPLRVARAIVDTSAGPADIIARQALWGVAVLLPLSSLLGAVFPLGMTLAVRTADRAARDAAFAYALNTIGAVTGSLTAAFVLVPALGLQPTIRAAGGVALAAGCLALAAGRLTSSQRMAGLAAAVTAAMLLALIRGWDPNLLSSGAYKYAREVDGAGLDLRTGLTAGTLLYYKEAAAATVSVRRVAATTALAIDGKVDASSGSDMLTQKLLGHLPLLLHPNPRQVAVIGLGSGVTLGAMLRHGVERADVVEISREVVEASRFFEHVNGRPLEDPRVRLIVGDGRSHLRLTSRRYDVLVSEPSNPWMAGLASLFTREFFLAVRDRLAPGGIVCQWAHTYDMREADLRSIAATFGSVFPNATMWLVGDGDVLLVAAADRAAPRLEAIGHAWTRPGVAANLADVGLLDRFGLMSLFVAGPEGLERFGRGATVQTDDRTGLEFSGPLGVYEQRGADNVAAIRALRDDDPVPEPVASAVRDAGPREWSHRGRMLLRAQAYEAAFDSFARALELKPGHEPALGGLVDASGPARREAEAQRLLEALAAPPGAPPDARLALGRLLAATGAFEPAAAQAEAVVAARPDDPRGLELLASVLADAGALDRLQPVVARMQQRHPDREDTAYYAAMVSFLSGDFRTAIERAEQAVRTNPEHALALNLIGSASANLGQRDRAREAFRASLVANPEEPTTYANLGLLELESGNRAAAAAFFGEALSLDPDNEAVRGYLASASAAGRR